MQEAQQMQDAQQMQKAQQVQQEAQHRMQQEMWQHQNQHQQSSLTQQQAFANDPRGPPQANVSPHQLQMDPLGGNLGNTEAAEVVWQLDAP